MKLKPVLLLCLVILVFGGAPARGSEQADRHYERGVAHERALRVFEALDEFRAAIALDPENTGLLEHYVWLLHTHRFQEEAVPAFEELLPRGTDQRAVRIGLGWNEMALGHAARSIGHFREVYALSADPDDVDASYTEIKALAIRENREKAAVLQFKLAADPADAAAGKALFQIYVYLSAWGDAFEVGEPLVEASRDDLAFRFAYFEALRLSGRMSDAEAVLVGLMADSPDNAYLHYELGRLLLTRERLPEAEDAIARSLTLYPGAIKTRKARCELLARSGRVDEAVAAAEALVRENESRLEPRLALARAFQFGQRWEVAIARYGAVLVDHPYNVEALAGLAESALRLGDITAAEAAVTTWVTADRGDREARRLRERVRRAAPAVTLQADSFSNSSGYRRQNAGLVARLPAWAGLSTHAGYIRSRFRHERFSDVDRDALFLEAEALVASVLHVEGRVDLNRYDTGQDRVNGGITLRAYPFGGRTHVGVGYRRLDIIDTEPVFGNPLYNFVASIGAVGEGITTDDFSLHLRQLVGDGLELWGNLTYGSYSDGNDKLAYVVGADYRLTDEPALHLRYSYFSLGYRQPAPVYREGDSQVAAYFDPDHFTVHTAGVELNFMLGGSIGVSLVDDVSYLADSKSFTNNVMCTVTLEISRRDELRLDLRYGTDVYRDGDEGDFGAVHTLLSYSHRF